MSPRSRPRVWIYFQSHPLTGRLSPQVWQTSSRTLRHLAQHPLLLWIWREGHTSFPRCMPVPPRKVSNSAEFRVRLQVRTSATRPSARGLEWMPVTLPCSRWGQRGPHVPVAQRSFPCAWTGRTFSIQGLALADLPLLLWVCFWACCECFYGKFGSLTGTKDISNTFSPQ